MLPRDFGNGTRGPSSGLPRPMLAERRGKNTPNATGGSSRNASREFDQGPTRLRLPGPAAQLASEWNSDAEKGRMMRHLCELGDFVRRMRTHTRFGDLSRARLKLLRFELHGDEAECNFVARRADPWDAGLPAGVAERNVSAQALRDAISIRALLFQMLPDISKAVLRVYRLTGESLELVITGVVRREEQAPATVRSLAMRAKLCGLQFWLDDGILESLHPEECLISA
jgi:hypothetical protein